MAPDQFQRTEDTKQLDSAIMYSNKHSMLLPSKLTIRRPLRSLIAVALSVIYLMITMSPLASLAMHSKIVAHAVTGECSGDCNICGCSLESRANRTCCCSKKRQQQALQHEDEQCRTPDCCDKKTPPSKKTVITRCNCPCGSEKTIALTNGSAYEQLPFYFTELFTQTNVDTHYSLKTHLLISRHAEPPDPPPRKV